MNALGKLLDKDALDDCEGARARARISVPPAWSAETALVEVALPRTLVCARCDGGGCDGCNRSGALRGPANESARKVRVRLPQNLGDGVAMRIASPLGGAAQIAQLWIEVRPSDSPSPTVRLLRLHKKPERRRVLPRMVAALGILVALLAVVLAFMTWARK